MPPERSEDVGQTIKRSLRWLITATVVLYVVLAILTFQSTASMCALKSDQKAQVATSQQFLVDHPQGIPGISVGVLQTGITNRKRTIHSLRFLFFC
jgi:hypothetical protein